MRILIIDSHKGSLKEPDNLHWLNASKLNQYFISKGDESKLIWSYPTVNDNVEENYDVVIFNHASHYSYVDYAWLGKSPNARLFYITNEYNLGEPRILWMAAKAGRNYKVFANHEGQISKVVKKYVTNWQVTNINALVVEEFPAENTLENPLIYYGSFRKDRIPSFQEYLASNKIKISTHKKNREKFLNSGTCDNFIDRLKWSKKELAKWRFSLYIEDETTHKNYNFLANRFYEALNHNTIPVFDGRCLLTMLKSGYENLIWEASICSFNEEEYLERQNNLSAWRSRALIEKQQALEEIYSAIQHV